ncbi:hypothetical protein G9A89_000176 [Geosiphon pyriformis]|nr:hypothetical protein G9A89_000176 [Geosiphon pyriformis]
MENNLLLSLVADLTSALQNSNHHDVEIEIGEQPTIKIFKAHSIILAARCPYFSAALSKFWVKRESKIITMTKPNIKPEIFEEIIKYIYTAKISIQYLEVECVIDILMAADELLLDELAVYLQTYMVTHRSEDLNQKFNLVNQVAFSVGSLDILQKYCTDFACKNSELLFESIEFYSWKEAALISLLKRDDLRMEESYIWDKVVSWAIENAGLLKNFKDWSPEDIQKLQITLCNVIPLIRFNLMSSSEFFFNVNPISLALPQNLFQELLEFYLVPGSEKLFTSPPRQRKFNSKFDSKIINEIQTCWIEWWISGSNETSKMPKKENKFNKKFELLLRGSQDGFNTSDFHRLCDNQGPTVIVIKIKGTNEIIGGYASADWKSNNQFGFAKDSFLFAFRINDDQKIILSRLKLDSRLALGFDRTNCPWFGSPGDLKMAGNFQLDCACYCRRGAYELEIRSTTACFSVDEYEVFKVLS